MKAKIILFFSLAIACIQGFGQNNIIDQLLDKPVTMTVINGDTFLQRDLTDYLTTIIRMNGQPTDSIESDDFNNTDLKKYLLRPHPSVSTIRKYFHEASNEFGVPVSLLMIIGQIENNWTQSGPRIDQGWGIMHLVKNNYCNTLEEAAKLIGVSEQELKDNALQNIRGAAALIAKYAGNNKEKFIELEDWFPAVSQFSGLISPELRDLQAVNYFETLKNGVRSKTLWGEEIIIEPEKKIQLKKNYQNKSNENIPNLPLSSDYGPALTNWAATCNYGTGRGSYSIDTWVNHWTDGTYYGTISWFQTCPCPSGTCPNNCPSGYRGCNGSTPIGPSSAHFVIKNSNGEITQMVLVANTAWHCGASGYPANNPRSIGVEHEVLSSNPSMWNSIPMLDASATMSCYFKQQYGFPTTQNASPGICGHNDMPGTSTSCPGPLPWSTWFSYFNNAPGCGGVSAPGNDNCTGAYVLTVNSSCNYTSGTTIGATSSGFSSCSGNMNDDDVFYYFNTGSLTSVTVQVQGSGTFDAAVQVLLGPCGGSMVQIPNGCIDVTAGGGLESRTFTGLSTNTTYYIRIGSYGAGSSNQGNFQVCVYTPATLPDFVVLSVSGPSSASPGDLVNVTIQAKNLAGNPTQPGTYVSLRLILSPDQTINLADSYYQDINIPVSSFQNNSVVTQNFSYTIPSGLSGTYYWGGYIDDLTYWTESNENNNATLGNTVILQPQPDFVVLNASGPSSALPGNSVNVTLQAKNLGGNPTQVGTYVSLRMILSPDQTINLADVYYQDINIPLSSFQNNAVVTQIFTYTVPTGLSGTYYWGGYIDDLTYWTESNENNNATLGNSVYLCSLPGLATISGPSSGCAGQALQFSANASGATTYTWSTPSDWSPNTGSGTNFTSIPGSSGNVTAIPSNSCGNGTPGSKNVTVTALPGAATVTGPSSGCAGTSLTFSANASNATSYNWTAPTDWTPNTGTGSSFTSTPGSSGNVTAIPTNSCGNGTQGSKSVLITALPGTATVNGPSSGCAGIALTFSATASNATTFNWSAPSDWAPPSGSGSSFTSTPGSSGNVTATPTNSCGNGTPGSKNVTINTLPGAATVTGPSSGCAGTSLTFSANASNATSYNWTAPTDWTPNTGIGSSFTSTPGSSGNVTATPTNSCGNGTPGSKNVIINTLPGAATVTGPSSGCAGTSLTFTATASNATTYNWTAPTDWTPNTGTGSSFTSTPGSSGNVTATPTNSCGNGTPGSKNVTINALPGAATVTGPSSGCAGTSLTFTATASNATTYNWTAPTDWTPNTGTGSSFTSTPGSSGNITATPTNSCGNGTPGSKNVTINSLPGAATITGPNSGCAGTSLTFNATASNATSFNWTAPADWTPNTGTGSTFTSTPGSSGNVTATPSNSCGNGPPCNQSMTITALPDTATVTGSDDGCSTPLTFYATASNAISFNWTAPSNWVPNIGSGTNFTTTPMSSGNVCATPYNNCGDGTQGCKYFTLNAGSGTAPNQPGPITGSLNPPSGTLQNYSISSVLNADSYLWTVPTSWVINSGQGTTSINVTIGVNSGNVCVSAVNFCGTSPQECSLISVIVGITEISFIKNLSVYPNPNSGDFILQLEILKPTDIEIELLTVLGQVVYMDKRNYQNGFYKIPIIFTQYPNGCYILKVKVDKETEVIRIIKE